MVNSERKLKAGLYDQFDRKWREEDEWSDHSSDVDESAEPIYGGEQAKEKIDDAFSREKIEYVDELGRTRVGTRAEAREVEEAKQKGYIKVQDPMEELEDQQPSIGPAHAEVL